jgi:hypothetical protein
MKGRNDRYVARCILLLSGPSASSLTFRRARKDQQAECGGGMRTDDGTAVGLLGRMLRFGVGLIHRVGQPDRFSLPDRLADLSQFRRCQVPLAALFVKILDPPARVEPAGQRGPCPRM